MSDGTLELLAYLLLMEDPEPAPLIEIAERENGLSPPTARAAGQRAEGRCCEADWPQVLITTHAPNLIDALSPSEVWTLHKADDGFAQIKRAADIPGVKEVYAEGVPMGSLWYSNHLASTHP